VTSGREKGERGKGARALQSGSARGTTGREATAPRRGEQELVRRYQGHGDPAARDELVARLTPLARRILRRYRGGPEPIEDLVQVGRVGIMKAIQGFDPDRGVALSTYATRVIDGELKHYFRDCCEPLHIPRALHHTVVRVAQAADDLSASWTRRPAAADVARKLGLERPAVIEALLAGAAHETLPLHVLDDRGEAAAGYVEALGSEDRRYEQIEDRDALLGALRRLSPVERAGLVLRAVQGKTWPEVGERLGVSASYASRLVRRASTRLRRTLYV
jgi:RNA polymerase sigma-B factor